jgi:hypothetical protein
MKKNTKDKNGYVLIYLPTHPFADNKGFVREHRLVIEKSIGRHLKRSELVDHINGITNDNRLENLRICTHKENIRNSKLRAVNNKSGYRGVSWDSTRALWQASIKVDYKSIGLGRFKTKRAAAIAYNEAAQKFFGAFANLNTIAV